MAPAEHGTITRRIFTDQQVREIRLAPENNVMIAARLGVSQTTIATIRRGEHYEPLDADEEAAQALRLRRANGAFVLGDSLIMFGTPRPMPGLHMADRAEAQDAAWECAHGRLPGDPTTPCGCFPQEQPSTNPQEAPDANRNTGETTEPRDPQRAGQPVAAFSDRRRLPADLPDRHGVRAAGAARPARRPDRVPV